MVHAGTAGPAPRGVANCQESPEGMGAPELVRAIELIGRHQPLSPQHVRSASYHQLRLLRNAVFASRGFKFRYQELTAFYSGFEWYSAVRTDVNSLLDARDHANLAVIQGLEACVKPNSAEPWRDGALLEVLLAKPNRKISARERPLIGTWQDPEQMFCDDCFPRTFAFFENGRLVDHGMSGTFVGNWSLDGSGLHARFFAKYGPRAVASDDDAEGHESGRVVLIEPYDGQELILAGPRPCTEDQKGTCSFHLGSFDKGSPFEKVSPTPTPPDL